MSDTPTVTDEMAKAFFDSYFEGRFVSTENEKYVRLALEAALAAQPEGNVGTQRHKGAHQQSGWIVFENTTGLFVGFFFNEDMARRYHARQAQDWTLERWERSNG